MLLFFRLRYLDYARYPEVAITLREALVSRFASDHRAAEVNAPDFDPKARESAEKAWAEKESSARTIGAVRNDIEHGGFNNQPMAAGVLKRRLRELVGEHLPERIRPAVVSAGKPQSGQPRQTYFVTRHPGAKAWAEEEGMGVDRLVDHLDVADIRPGDRVIGSLPVNLAAEVCARGGRYLHLTLELSAELRGKELTAADMRRLGARVEEFRVEQVG